MTCQHMLRPKADAGQQGLQAATARRAAPAGSQARGADEPAQGECDATGRLGEAVQRGVPRCTHRGFEARAARRRALKLERPNISERFEREMQTRDSNWALHIGEDRRAGELRHDEVCGAAVPAHQVQSSPHRPAHHRPRL
jgi:hypothetical protein